MTQLYETQNAFGTEAEQRVAQYLTNAGWWVNTAPSSRAERDLSAILGHRCLSIEVKNEDRYADSGNICIETQQGQEARPSGLAITESNVVVHTLGDRVALYRAQPMRMWLRANMERHGLELRYFGEADNRNAGVVLPVRLLQGVERWFECCKVDALARSEVWTWVPR